MSESKEPVAISVVMSVYNAEKTVELALRSTLLALPKKAELLVLLNSCSDGTESIVASISDTRLKTIVSKSALSVDERLNRLLRISSGEFVARMDADDICLPWRFKYQRFFLVRGGCDFIFTNAILFGSRNGRPLLQFQPPMPLNADQCSMALAFSNPLVHPTMLARRTSLIELGGYRDVPADDLDLWLRATLADKKIKRLGGYGILYRVHDGQLTQTSDWQLRHQCSGAVPELRNQLSEHLHKVRPLKIVRGVPLTLGQTFVTSSIPVMIQFLGFKRIFRLLTTRRVISWPSDIWHDVS
jgi:hypothetical protein